MVITIIGILVALLLPAVQNARESARSAQCKNNLVQFGVAALHHEQAKGYFPSGGWGSGWVGDPNQGFGYKQPGNWAYSLLPFLEQTPLWSLGQGQSLSARPALLAQQVTNVVPGFYCPSGRSASLYPYTEGSSPVNTTSLSGQNVMKIDYAINAGDYPYQGSEFAGPPLSILPSGYSSYTGWPNTSMLTGVSFVHSQVKLAHITDGASNTYLIGEKYLDPNNFTNGADPGDNETAMTGFSDDTFRYGGVSPPTSPQTGAPPMHDTAGSASTSTNGTATIWGSIHPSMVHFVFCDGSVHDISFSINPETHRRLSNRADGQQVDQSIFQ